MHFALHLYAHTYLLLVPELVSGSDVNLRLGISSLVDRALKHRERRHTCTSH